MAVVTVLIEQIIDEVIREPLRRNWCVNHRKVPPSDDACGALSQHRTPKTKGVAVCGNALKVRDLIKI
jgi:hypothetical protein